MQGLTITAEFGRDADDLSEMHFKIDPTSFYTILPPTLVAELKLPAMMKASVAFGGRTVGGVRIGVAYLRLMAREGGVPFAAIDVPEPVLGITALEALGLRLDDTACELQYAASYGAGALLLDEEDF